LAQAKFWLKGISPLVSPAIQEMQLLHRCLLVLGTSAALSAGHAGLRGEERALSNEDVSTQRLAGVRKCLALHAGDEMEVLAMKQRYGKESFLVARPAGSPKLVAKAALHATYEALLTGAGCSDAKDPSSTAWLVDVGTDDDEVLALASSLGCGVTVLDAEVKDVRAVDMTRCMNEEPNRPFVIFQVSANNVTNPESLANMTKPVPTAESWAKIEAAEAVPSNKTEAPSASTLEKQKAHEEAKLHPRAVAKLKAKLSALIVMSKPRVAAVLQSEKKPRVMLNKIRRIAEEKRKREEAQAKAASVAKAAKDATVALAAKEKAMAAAVALAAKEKAEAEAEAAALKAAAEEPMESGVMLDDIFTRDDGEVNVSAFVATPEGDKVEVNKISVLKITPRSETDATIKALQGSMELLKSGRVKCLVTEMNFDLNTTETFLELVTELEANRFKFAHMGSQDYSELEVTDQGQYEVFATDGKQLTDIFGTYKRIRSFDERSGFRVYSGSLSLDRKGHYFDYTDVIFACRDGFPKKMSILAQAKTRFQNGVWWLEKAVR